MRKHSIINLDRSNTIDWFISRFQINCQAVQWMDVDCTEVHIDSTMPSRMSRTPSKGSIELLLRSSWTSSFFTQEYSAINDNLKHYIHGLHLFLDKSPDEYMDDFEESFKKAFIISTSDHQLPKEDQEVAGVEEVSVDAEALAWAARNLRINAAPLLSSPGPMMSMRVEKSKAKAGEQDLSFLLDLLILLKPHLILQQTIPATVLKIRRRMVLGIICWMKNERTRQNTWKKQIIEDNGVFSVPYICHLLLLESCCVLLYHKQTERHLLAERPKLSFLNI